MRGRNCYVVSYDIMEQKRLQKVHKTMKGFGDAVHYSVFRCDHTPKGRVEMIAALTDLIKHDEDRVMIIDLGPAEGMAEDRIEFHWSSVKGVLPVFYAKAYSFKY